MAALVRCFSSARVASVVDFYVQQISPNKILDDMMKKTDGFLLLCSVVFCRIDSPALQCSAIWICAWICICLDLHLPIQICTRVTGFCTL